MKCLYSLMNHYKHIIRSYQVSKALELLSLLLLSLRAERESLESALFDGQELISSLEADQTRLEGERGSLQQANEALTCEYLSGSLWPPKNSPCGAHISDIPEI